MPNENVIVALFAVAEEEEMYGEKMPHHAMLEKLNHPYVAQDMSIASVHSVLQTAVAVAAAEQCIHVASYYYLLFVVTST